MTTWDTKLVRHIERLSEWADENKSKVESYRSAASISVGLLLMFLGYQIGNSHFHLILDGIRTNGRIVEYERTVINPMDSTSTTFIPIVELQYKNQTIRFKDWKGSQSNSPKDVLVIYDLSQPSVAMIDRPIWNWMPWAPMFIGGLLLLLASIKNWLKFRLAITDTSQVVNTHGLPESKFLEQDDPLALKVSWEPANPGGANFKMQNMIVSENLIVLKKSSGAILFLMLFVVVGMLGLVVAGPSLILNGQIMFGLVLMFFGFVFGGIGLLFLTVIRNSTFDRVAGVYYLNKTLMKSEQTKPFFQGLLSDIHAIQLLSEQINSKSADGDSSNFTSYELNLVFKDGGRLNIMDHGREQDVEASAKQLGEFLSVPVWRNKK